jgi:hypothetical protein
MTGVKKITLTALFTALGILIPIVFHTNPMFGSVFLPMHITVIVCAMITGPYRGMICAALTAFISSIVTGMPPIYPVGVIMIFELITYASVAGILTKILIVRINKIAALYTALIAAMLAGRIIMGAASVIFIGLIGNGYSMKAFITAAFITALPGIIIQLAIIPWIILVLRKYLALNYE